MKKRFAMTELDCANCAAKMEAAIRKIDGVNDASVSFLAQKLVLDADDARFDDILRQAIAAIKKVDSNVDVVVK